MNLAYYVLTNRTLVNPYYSTDESFGTALVCHSLFRQYILCCKLIKLNSHNKIKCSGVKISRNVPLLLKVIATAGFPTYSVQVRKKKNGKMMILTAQLDLVLIQLAIAYQMKVGFAFKITIC